MVKNCSCFCQGLKCPCVPACPHLYVSLSTLCGNLKKETLSKYWHTSPTLRISISSAPPLYANVAHATGSQLVIRHLGYRWRKEKKSYLLLQKIPSMSLGIARKSSKNWSGFFCVLDALLGRRRSIFVVFVSVVFLEKENMYYASSYMYKHQLSFNKPFFGNLYWKNYQYKHNFSIILSETFLVNFYTLCVKAKLFNNLWLHFK